VDVEIEAIQHAMLAKGLTETDHPDEWICGHASIARLSPSRGDRVKEGTHADAEA